VAVFGPYRSAPGGQEAPAAPSLDRPGIPPDPSTAPAPGGVMLSALLALTRPASARSARSPRPNGLKQRAPAARAIGQANKPRSIHSRRRIERRPSALPRDGTGG